MIQFSWQCTSIDLKHDEMRVNNENDDFLNCEPKTMDPKHVVSATYHSTASLLSADVASGAM